MSPSKPVIATARTTLHRFSANDAEDFYQLNLNPENVRFTGDAPFASVEQAKQFIANYDHYQLHGFGRWSVYLNPDEASGTSRKSRYIGFCGLRKNSQNGLVDIGYRIDQKYWGRGLATEISQSVLAYGFEHLSLPIIVSRARVDNPASIAVLNKTGFTNTGEEQEDGFTWLFFELKKTAWIKNRQK